MYVPKDAERECKDTINKSYNINKTTRLSKLCFVPLIKK